MNSTFLFIAILATLAALASAQRRFARCPMFYRLEGRDTPYKFDDGEEAANGVEDCMAIISRRNGVAGVFRGDNKRCYIKKLTNLEDNGFEGVMYTREGAALGHIDTPNLYDAGNWGRDQPFPAGQCDLVIDAWGKWWCKNLERCDACTMLIMSQCPA
ncbi:hypothetical protein BCR44DRAFT_56821 [Catenaria anguillulae PL171]|uniref:C-type lectin domain-containing protein n=1 Tax=Catenaria anguillulae PL171 TaxID=765915 RepID=A0A1Y2HXW4_9FUNG|nr:hypothetical protein BCR44DRAFT_56821 [Catenaria anguillulae PL171]